MINPLNWNILNKEEEEEEMAKFLFVYYGGMMAATPAEQKKSMDAWMGWFGKMGEAVVDAGAPTKPGKILSKTGAKSIGADPVTGYSIIKAENMNAAVALAKGTPNIPDGGQVAVYELLPM
jgi:hypothetical protein